MGKKINREEPKKECPSCGLGVSLEANMCEFCGWDFEEEDEWTLQIEKLERELMLEKKRFEPGTVDHKIESTLRTPAVESTRPPEPEEPVVAQTAVDLIEPEAERPEREQVMAAPEPRPGLRVRSVREVPRAQPDARGPAPGAPRMRRVKMPAQNPPQPVAEQPPRKRIRTIRKVKG